MEPLGQDSILGFAEDEPDAICRCKAGLPIAASDGLPVSQYPELLRKIAGLNYYNPRFKLLFRGQARDYKLNTAGEPGDHSSLYPSILRSGVGAPRKEILEKRFLHLSRAERLLDARLQERSVRLHQLVRWAILQHYEICATPLLDVTQSLQTALSFALADLSRGGYLYVLAVPQLSGPISVSLESMTQVVDLCQVCPPQALRPHFQSGILVGDYPALTSVEATHGGEGRIGNNFASRLLAKFVLLGGDKWLADGFTPTASSILFPNENDDWFSLLDQLRRDVDSGLTPA